MTKKKKVEPSLINKLNDFVAPFVAVASTLDKKPFDADQFPKLENDRELYKEMEKRAALKYFEFLLSALTKGDKQKAMRHAAKLKQHLIPTHNDNPFKRGDRVEVTRYEHGWNMLWTARIDEVHKDCNGKYSYTATVVKDENGNCKPFEITINHTRDAHRTY